MSDLQIIQQSLNGYHLEPKEIKILEELIQQLTKDLNNRTEKQKAAIKK